MKCPNCGDNFILDVIYDVIVQEVVHNEQKIDVIITCPFCGHRHKGVVDIDNCLDLDNKQ